MCADSLEASLSEDCVVSIKFLTFGTCAEKHAILIKRDNMNEIYLSAKVLV